MHGQDTHRINFEWNNFLGLWYTGQSKQLTQTLTCGCYGMICELTNLLNLLIIFTINFEMNTQCITLIEYIKSDTFAVK